MMIHFLFKIVAYSLVASLVLSADVRSASPDHTRLYLRHSTSNACAQVANLSAIYNADPANQGLDPMIPAKLAYDCLTSVPFNQSAAIALVNNIKPILEFQSTTAMLKNPPRSWAMNVRPGYDLFGEFEKVVRKVTSGAYKNEHQFGMELFQVIQFAHDPGLQYLPDSIGTAFLFMRGTPSLVSVSANGHDLPNVYSFDDITAELLGNASFKASPITHINGQDAKSFLENDSKWNYDSDPHTTYNGAFTSLSSRLSDVNYIGTFKRCGDMGAIYPGPTTTFRFANGTRKSFDNYAVVLVPFDGISDGESLYQTYYTTPKIFVDNNQSASQTPSNSTSTTSPQQAPGYPQPIFLDSTNNLGGFYLENHYSDVAVLSIPSFEPTSDPTLITQDYIAKFVVGAKAAGKKKLIIDLQSNPGGLIELAYNLFKILFPRGRDHSAAMRFRATDATRLISKVFSKVAEKYPPKLPDTLYENTSTYTDYWTTMEYDSKYVVNTQSQSFKRWTDFFGPYFHNGDWFSSLFRYNLTSELFSVGMYGYGKYASYTQQPFKAQDIIILTDGKCSSACSVFVDLMRVIQKVKTVAIGGRPRYGPMQPLGSNRGPRLVRWTEINVMMQLAIQDFNTPEESARLMKTKLATLMEPLAYERSAPGTISNINFLDAVRDGDWSNTALQFKYEPAECRMLLTKKMVVDITAIWKAVADSAWGWHSHCIDGNLHASGTYWRQ
ncbi:hypothetical protein ACJQWK_10157 [Exserohilum turcicum]